MDSDFWQTMSRLVATSPIVLDRPKGSPHPRYPEVIYPLDYGYLPGTTSTDRQGIDVWLGSLANKVKSLTGILCTFDTLKHDLEVKLLIGCTEQDIQIIRDFHNDMDLLYLPNPMVENNVSN
jgi:inorganic pyrophosphatase